MGSHRGGTIFGGTIPWNITIFFPLCTLFALQSISDKSLCCKMQMPTFYSVLCKNNHSAHMFNRINPF
jgi:hypothetical protein